MTLSDACAVFRSQSFEEAHAHRAVLLADDAIARAVVAVWDSPAPREPQGDPPEAETALWHWVWTAWSDEALDAEAAKLSRCLSMRPPTVRTSLDLLIRARIIHPDGGVSQAARTVLIRLLKKR